MPFKDCIENDNKLYIWNSETGSIDVYTRKSIPIDKCPPDVVSGFMRFFAEKAKNAVLEDK